MVGCQSNDRVEGIQRVVNDHETLNSDSTRLDSSPAGVLTVKTSRTPRAPQTPRTPDRRLTRPLSWHKLAVRMNVTLTTVVSAFQSTPRHHVLNLSGYNNFCFSTTTSPGHHVNQTSAVSVEQLDTCILLPASSRVNIVHQRYSCVNNSCRLTTVSHNIFRTLNVVRTIHVQNSVWRQYCNRCMHTAVKHTTRVT